eukprot:CAMPEP_0194301540 /NCGR_PEP_ID=MMETSP0169-20130528/61852_1 /TAXON_ID=218684 /ORGANISM="Corethron pennatum, Strain L29A3" /LENGTH=581 /DNA_ID=CAMNT_0039051799 /DNA_START=30 /DNA_END=1775 /DNA_ORIENTATION=+
MKSLSFLAAVSILHGCSSSQKFSLRTPVDGPVPPLILKDGRASVLEHPDTPPNIFGLRLFHEGGGDICFYPDGSVITRTHVPGTGSYAIEEVYNGRSYSYVMVDVDTLRERHADSETPWIDGLSDVKYNCEMRLKEGIKRGDAPSPLQRHGNTWIAPSGYIIRFEHGSPVAIASGDVEILVTEMGECPSRADITGCDPFLQGGSNTALPKHIVRQLESTNPVSDWKQFVTGTQWCGPGNDQNQTPCPNRSNSINIQADLACRRHDHGLLSEDIVGKTIKLFECSVDAELAAATLGHDIIQGVYGENGIAKEWGCVEFGDYKCWQLMDDVPTWGDFCDGVHIKLGSERYVGATMHWGYRIKTKQCRGDLWEQPAWSSWPSSTIAPEEDQIPVTAPTISLPTVGEHIVDSWTGNGDGVDGYSDGMPAAEEGKRGEDAGSGSFSDGLDEKQTNGSSMLKVALLILVVVGVLGILGIGLIMRKRRKQGPKVAGSRKEEEEESRLAIETAEQQRLAAMTGEKERSQSRRWGRAQGEEQATNEEALHKPVSPKRHRKFRMESLKEDEVMESGDLDGEGFELQYKPVV